MDIVTLAEFKANTRIDNTYEDEYIKGIIIPSATNVVRQMLRRDWEDVLEENGEIPVEIKNAILMVADELFKHRGVTERVSQHTNKAFRPLICKHIKLRK